MTTYNPDIITDGVRLISAVVRDRSQTIFRRIRREQLLDAEVPLYDFVNTHLRSYGVVPSFDTVRTESARRAAGTLESRFPFAEVTDSCDYYLTQVSQRAVYNTAVQFQQPLVQAIQSRDSQRITEVGRQLYTSLNQQGHTQDVTPILDVGQALLADVRESQMSSGTNGVTTGYEPVDSDLMGLKGGELLILAGRPKMGKTYYMLAMILHAWLSGKSILFVSMEMSPKGLVSRIASILARMNPRILRGNEITSHAYNRYSDTIQGFSELPPFNFVAGNFSKTPADIERVLATQPADYVAIDGGYLLKPNDRNSQNAKHEMLADVINDVKAMLENFHVPGFVTVQFNRMAAGTARSNRRGNTNANFDIEYLAGTDAFGQTATAVMGISKIRGVEDKRRLKMLVARDADGSADMTVNFGFNPPDFSYVEPFVEEQSGGAIGGLTTEQAITEI